MKNLPRKIGLRLTLVSAEELRLTGAAFSKQIHPCLLLSQELKSGPPLWKVDLEINQGEVYLLTEEEAHPKQQICSLQMGEDGLNSILNLEDLHLTIIRPLLNLAKDGTGITIRDGLAMRRPLFDRYMKGVYDELDWESSLSDLHRYFSKDGKKDLQTVCLKVEISNKELKPMCSLFSDPIINSKSISKKRQQPGPDLGPVLVLVWWFFLGILLCVLWGVLEL